MALSAKQATFAREYAVDKNATQAAIRAGYEWPSGSSGYYVYLLMDGEEIFYVGKGKGARIFSHRRDAFKPKPVNPIKAQRIKDAGKNLSERLFATGLDEVQALALERALIRRWRANLTNITSGNIHPAQSELARSEAGLMCLRSFDEWVDCATDQQLISAMDSHGTPEAFYLRLVGGLLDCHEAMTARLNLIKGESNGAGW